MSEDFEDMDDLELEELDDDPALADDIAFGDDSEEDFE